MTEAAPKLIVPFNDHVRVEFAQTLPGSCVARIPGALELTNHLGTVHGGALFTVAEAASGRAFMEIALKQALAAGWDLTAFRAVVRDAQIQFRKPARGEIHARAQVITPTERWTDELRSSGKALVHVEVQVKDTAGTLVAEMHVQWHVSNRQKSAT